MELPNLPYLYETCDGELQRRVVIDKVHFCETVFDPTSTDNIQERDLKTTTLNELCDYVSHHVIDASMYPHFTRMISANIFRTLPARPCYDPEEDEPLLNPYWLHTQQVFQVFIHWLDSPHFDVALAKNYIDHKFISQMMSMFASEDHRERHCFKVILHRLYEKFIHLRPFVRTEIRNLFCIYVQQSNNNCNTNPLEDRVVIGAPRCNGIPELLDILGSVVAGYNVPLKDEHKMFLLKAMIPLYKGKSFSLYHLQLSFCVAQFMAKDQAIVMPVFKSILRMWPHYTDSTRITLYIAHIGAYLKRTHPACFRMVCVPLFKKIAPYIADHHFKIAEAVLLLFHNEHVCAMILENLRVLLPILFLPLVNGAKTHWHRAIADMSIQVLNLFMQTDREFFTHCANTMQDENINRLQRREFIEKQWEELELSVNDNVAMETDVGVIPME